jgi:hypothetical protein
MKNFLIYIVLSISIISSCSYFNSYDMQAYHSAETIDTLMANIVTYVNRLPTYANNENRFEPQFRKFYVGETKNYKMIHYTIDKNGFHYFYMIRQARNTKGYKRSMVGRFKLNENDLKPIDFEELAVSYMLPEEDLIENSLQLFEYLIKDGNSMDYPNRKDFIEWPDDKLYYDVSTSSWVHYEHVRFPSRASGEK